MALYIRDDTVDELAIRLAGLMGLNKTEAVRVALESTLDNLSKRKSLIERVRGIQTAARAAGLSGKTFDAKPKTDSLVGGL